MWLSGKDRAGAIAFTMLMNGPDGQDEIRVEPQPIAGQSPADLLPAAGFKAAMTAGTQLLLAVRGGPALTSPGPIENIDQGPGPHNVAVLVEAQPMTVNVNGQTIYLNAERRVFYASAKLADPTTAQNAQPGDEIRLVPPANNTAILVATTSA